MKNPFLNLVILRGKKIWTVETPAGCVSFVADKVYRSVADALQGIEK